MRYQGERGGRRRVSRELMKEVALLRDERQERRSGEWERARRWRPVKANKHRSLQRKEKIMERG